MSDNPDIQWALDLLTPKPDDKVSIYSEYGLVFGVPVLSFIGICLQNKFTRRPIFAGFQYHIILTALGYVGARALQNKINSYYARRDQLLKDYIILHPEDFPPPERKKWSQVFDPWSPIR